MNYPSVIFQNYKIMSVLDIQIVCWKSVSVDEDFFSKFWSCVNSRTWSVEKTSYSVSKNWFLFGQFPLMKISIPEKQKVLSAMSILENLEDDGYYYAFL